MHRCLQVYELAARIAEACVPDYEDAGGSSDIARGYKPQLGTLCALARTCRTLQEPAFDVLWSFQFGLQNLIKCMPEDLWEIHRLEDLSPRYKPRGTADHFYYDELKFNASRSVTQNDLERFDFYAKRVRRLECSQYYMARLGMAKWSYAETTGDTILKLQELKGGPLLPNVHSIRRTVRDIRGASLDSLNNLLAPTLTSLSLLCEHGRGEEKLSEGITAVLPTHYPRLQRLVLRIFPGNLDTGSLPQVLRKCGLLRQLTLDIFDRRGVVTPSIVDSRFLSELATFPKLYDLRITARTAYIRAQNIAHPVLFSSVKALYLDYLGAQSIISILEDCNFPSLTELNIYFERSELALGLISETVSSRIAHHTLQSLTVSYLGPSYGHTEAAAIPMSDSLQPLLVFRNLRRLHIEIRCKVAISLTDMNLERCSQAWPHLRHLVIISENNSLLGSLPTYHGLAHLVRHCPHLHSLALLIAATPTIRSDDLADLPTSTQNTMLNFYWSEAGDLWSAASWVARMFPRVLEVKGRGMHLPTWKEVGKKAAELRDGATGGPHRDVVRLETSGS